MQPALTLHIEPTPHPQQFLVNSPKHPTLTINPSIPNLKQHRQVPISYLIPGIAYPILIVYNTLIQLSFIFIQV